MATKFEAIETGTRGFFPDVQVRIVGGASVCIVPDDQHRHAERIAQLLNTCGLIESSLVCPSCGAHNSPTSWGCHACSWEFGGEMHTSEEEE